jgi:signal transduction histidine kinase
MKLGSLNTIAVRIAATIIVAILLGIALEVFVGFSIAYLGGLSSERADDGPRIVASRSAIFVVDPRHHRGAGVNFGGFGLRLVTKLVTTASLIASTPANDRAVVAAAASRPNLRLAIQDSAPTLSQESESSDLKALRQLVEFELGVPSRSVIVSAPAPASPDATAVVLGTELPDGQWLVMTVPGNARQINYFHLALVLGSLSALIGLVSVIAARRLARPIRTFARAAERFGVDSTAAPIAECGPRELRTAIRTFNHMQERLRRFVDDRTQMLAAMSHDLRTPLNRLRLRAEFIEDCEQQRKMFADLEAMNLMIDQTLAFARDDARREPRTLVDVGVLVEDLCEDAADAGASVSYAGPRGVNALCRPAAVGRAVANLVDNAVKYAGAAQVRLLHWPDRIIILVEDHGPGISPDECEKVFAPFYRLERSRNSDTGGVGLGLSVARTIVRAHGGDITLKNRSNHGLCARLELPAAPASGA